jgi:hypothetical protein
MRGRTMFFKLRGQGHEKNIPIVFKDKVFALVCRKSLQAEKRMDR